MEYMFSTFNGTGVALSWSGGSWRIVGDVGLTVTMRQLSVAHADDTAADD